MRLEKIKLAGFKSFVDPTSLSIPGRLIGVVGPNGCGKSNIIDAVRWVMGESSAKHLRGSAMSDVIFNGSSSRKPVGLASIELIFDNGEGRLGGEYARYAQISVKRQVSRDGQSQYFLNNTRCRRRDIMDVFLGTGLGPRSYAIIEQGTVSRFIEAKPEELRLFVEEAAGLSKYKERRHETELKLQHTRANLERVEDIRGELQTQVNRLARQAKKAAKFRELEGAIANRHKELLAIQWRDAKNEYQRHQEQLTELELALSQREANLKETTTTREKSREQVRALERQLQQQQARLYELNAEISRYDQALKHAQQSQAQRQLNLESWHSELQRSHAALDQDNQQMTALQKQQQQLAQELTQAREEFRQASSAHQECEAQWQQNRREYGRHLDELRSLREKINLLEVEIRHNEHRREEFRRRIGQLAAQQDQIELDQNDEEATTLQDRLEEIETLLNDQRDQSRQLNGELKQLREQQHGRQEELRQLEAELSRLAGRISALETLQRHALGKDRRALQQWLEAHQWHQVPRLAEKMEVERGWETAVETVLGSWLEALTLDDLQSVADTADSLKNENASFLEPSSPPSPPPGSLAEKLGGEWNPIPLLGHHRCIDSLPEAVTRRGELADHECWITPNGDQIGLNWLKLTRHQDSGQGVLEREKELRRLRHRQEQLMQQKEQIQEVLEHLITSLNDVEITLDTLRRQEREVGSRKARLQAELQAAHRRCEETRQRLQRLQQEQSETQGQLTKIQQEIDDHTMCLQRHKNEIDTREEKLEQLQAELDQARAANDQATDLSRSIREKTARLETALEHTRHSLQLLEKQRQRTGVQCEELEQRLALAETEQTQGQHPLNQLKQQLEQSQARRPALEKELIQTRTQLRQAEEMLREQHSLHAHQESQRDQARADLEAARLKAEAARVRLQTAAEQIESETIDPDRILKTLEPEAKAHQWQKGLEQLQRDQARLGDVNLAAIEEHRLHSERLRFLDKQYEDLTTSLEMLDKAIRTIDKETRSRFRETFETVDGHFRKRFPALFGGGEARLEMTSDDPLEAGIRIMARPPGKRNSSIHLLSGGEKALTAVALVFSFFELNPAPFCMLDEVDAPLDEANVGRFCTLLQSMSERVQFIFVTHNKTTMEIADQLIGVTMREPGVSRIVSVDLERAAEMAAA